MTLQCLEFLSSESLCNTNQRFQTGQVAMKQCNATDGQYLHGNDTRRIHCKLCSGKKNMHLQIKEDLGYPVESIRTRGDQSWTRIDNNAKKTSTYTGQQTFFKTIFYI